MGILELALKIDKQIQTKRLYRRRKYDLHKLFLIECKYNLDVLQLLKPIISNDDPQVFEIIELLSITALENILIESSIADADSFLVDMGINLLEEIKKLNCNEDDSLNYDEPVVLNIYKRIEVLRAFSKLSKPYSAIINVDLNLRLKNLKKQLLIIVNKSK
jgi:hypothetical protein